MYNLSLLALIYAEYGSISSPFFSINYERANRLTFSIINKEEGFLTITIFLLRYLASGRTLGRKGDSVTTYVIIG